MSDTKIITMKTVADFEKMEIAGAAVAAVHVAVREAAAPGVSMKELDAISAAILKERKCTPSFLGYHGFPATICASPNSTIVHGIPDDYRLREGDIVSIDAGAIYEGWHGDAAPCDTEKLVPNRRSVGVRAKADDRQHRELLQIPQTHPHLHI